jgi:hypothetical protein
MMRLSRPFQNPTLLPVALAAAVALSAPAVAAASIGTGVGATPLTLSRSARPGGTYTVRWLYVKNTGTVRAGYRVRVARLSSSAKETVPPDWVRLDPAGFELAPGAIARVTVRLAVPASAAAGSYMTDLVASTAARHAPGATALGAAAADQLSFRIPSTAAGPWLLLVVIGGTCLLVVTAVVTRSRRRTRHENGALVTSRNGELEKA